MPSRRRTDRRCLRCACDVLASAQKVRDNIKRRVAQQLQDLGGEFRRGHKAYLAKLKGQSIEEYRPDLSLNDGPGAAGSSGGFFDDEPACAGSEDPRCAWPTPVAATRAARRPWSSPPRHSLPGTNRSPHASVRPRPSLACTRTALR